MTIGDFNPIKRDFNQVQLRMAIKIGLLINNRYISEKTYNID